MSVPGSARGATARGAIKICGVTSVEDARRSLDLGADLIGLNFHPPSPRCVSVGAARTLRREIGDRALVVGVFVHHTPEEASSLGEAVGLDLLQFHGRQTPDDLAAVAERAIVVLRPGDEVRAGTVAGFWGVLFDAPLVRADDGETLFGGTGRAWDFDRVARAGAGVHRLMLAGGIGPENVQRALAVDGVWGVDVCSGVESSPGVKDAARLEALFEAARSPRVAMP